MCGKERGVEKGKDHSDNLHTATSKPIRVIVSDIQSILSVSVCVCPPFLPALRSSSLMVTMDMLGYTMRAPSFSGKWRRER